MKLKYLLINFFFILFNFLKIKEQCNFRILMFHNIEKKKF